MNSTKFSWELFLKVPVVGILRGLTLEEVMAVLPLYLDAGLTTVEVTMNTDSAAEIIRYSHDHFGGRLNIGAGTVCNSAELELALDAGAQFIVTPVLVEEVIQICLAKKIPVFPGAYTPTEIFKAWQMGAPLVKVFPATSLGTQFIRDVKGPFDKLKLMPTGGINLNNMHHFIDAGAQAVGIGSHLFDPQLIKARDWDALLTHFKKFTLGFSITTGQVQSNHQ